MHWDSIDVLAWLGRAGAAIENWSIGKKIEWDLAITALRRGRTYDDGAARLIILLHQAQNDLRMKTVGPINVAIGQGHVFDYMKTIKDILGQARIEAFFIDRYMNSDFATKFLPLINDGVSVKLLTRRDPKTEKPIQSLLSMASAYAAQHKSHLEIRSHNNHHQRYLFLDGSSGYESGSSFKDGPTTAGVTIVEHTGSTLSELLSMHRALWTTAKLEFATER